MTSEIDRITGNTRAAFIGALLRAIGAPVTADTTSFMLAWIVFETNAGNAKYNNPMNVSIRATELETGTHAGFISIFPNLNTGLQAHVILLRNARYAPTVTALRAGDIVAAASALQVSGWCGGPGNLCPNYGPKILAKARFYNANPKDKQRDGDVPAGTSKVLQGETGLDSIGSAGEAFADDPLGFAGALAESGAGFLGDLTGLSAIDAFASAGVAVLRWLTTADNWARLGQGAAGLGMIAVALTILGKDLAAETVGSVIKPITEAVT